MHRSPRDSPPCCEALKTSVLQHPVPLQNVGDVRERTTRRSCHPPSIVPPKSQILPPGSMVQQQHSLLAAAPLLSYVTAIPLFRIPIPMSSDGRDRFPSTTSSCPKGGDGGRCRAAALRRNPKKAKLAQRQKSEGTSRALHVISLQCNLKRIEKSYIRGNKNTSMITAADRARLENRRTRMGQNNTFLRLGGEVGAGEGAWRL